MTCQESNLETPHPTRADRCYLQARVHRDRDDRNTAPRSKRKFHARFTAMPARGKSFVIDDRFGMFRREVREYRTTNFSPLATAAGVFEFSSSSSIRAAVGILRRSDPSTADHEWAASPVSSLKRLLISTGSLSSSHLSFEPYVSTIRLRSSAEGALGTNVTDP